jgi:hypothetical protein
MDFGFHVNLVMVCGRIDAHQIDAIATPTHELPPEFENSIAGNFAGAHHMRARCGIQDFSRERRTTYRNSS